MKRLKIDFNPSNQKLMLETLNEQLRQGFKLTNINAFFGTLTFEPMESGGKTAYEIARYDSYENGLNVGEPWISCGRIGGREIFRFDGDGIIPKFPKADRSPEDGYRKRMKRTLICGIALIALSLIMLAVDIFEMAGSAAALFDSSRAIQTLQAICFLAVGISDICQYFANPYDKAASDNRRGKWFANFVLPWIIGIAILAGVFWTVCTFGRESQTIPIPDERLPFSENAEKCYAERSFGGDVYEYGWAFLYDVRWEKTAERLFEEAKTDSSKGKWAYQRFGNCNVRTEISADEYANIDRILSCTENSDFYELTYNAVIILRGNELFGYCYDKEEFTEGEILSEINKLYERTDKNG